MNVENEIYNIVDENDQIIGQASRKHIHKNKLLHRSVHTLVFNSRKELFLQKRALCKDENPGLWDTSSAGHVDAGESYDACAHRELGEELNLKATLKTSIKISACQETYGEHEGEFQLHQVCLSYQAIHKTSLAIDEACGDDDVDSICLAEILMSKANENV